MTSVEIVVEFVKGRPELEKLLRKKMTDGFMAPELGPIKAQEIILGAFGKVSEEERSKLDRMRGNGNVDWGEVARAFGWGGAPW